MSVVLLLGVITKDGSAVVAFALIGVWLLLKYAE